MRTDTRTASTTDVGFLLAVASRRFNERLTERLAAAGVPNVRAAYGSVLVPLFEQNGLRVGEIGGRSRLSKQSMTRLVAQCEADGLVRRRRDADDGRAFRVELTERGQRLRGVAHAVMDELDAEIGAALGLDDHAALKRALRGVVDL